MYPTEPNVHPSIYYLASLAKPSLDSLKNASVKKTRLKENQVYYNNVIWIMQQRQIEDSPYSLQSAMGSAATAAARRGFADSESFASNLPPQWLNMILQRCPQKSFMYNWWRQCQVYSGAILMLCIMNVMVSWTSESPWSNVSWTSWYHEHHDIMNIKVTLRQGILQHHFQSHQVFLNQRSSVQIGAWTFIIFCDVYQIQINTK